MKQSRMHETVIVIKSCKCDVSAMAPAALEEPVEPFTHICSICTGGITFAAMNMYNKYYGYSGYDE